MFYKITHNAPAALRSAEAVPKVRSEGIEQSRQKCAVRKADKRFWRQSRRGEIAHWRWQEFNVPFARTSADIRTKSTE